MLGVTGLFDPLGLYQKDTAPRSGKTRGPMIVANGLSPIAEFGLKGDCVINLAGKVLVPLPAGELVPHVSKVAGPPDEHGGPGVWSLFTPVTVTTGVQQSSCGRTSTNDGFSLFVKTNGTLWATGYNQNGQLGDAT